MLRHPVSILKSIGILLLLFSFSSVAEEKKYLALGDSYTIGEGVAEVGCWPNQLMALFRQKGLKFAKPLVIAGTGWQVEDLKNAIAEAKLSHDYDLVSLLIGVNDQYRGNSTDQYAKEFNELTLTAIQLAKGKKGNVFVVSIPDYGWTPLGESRQAEISGEIDQFNAINKSIAEKQGIAYFDITDISRAGLKDNALVAGDGLHPSWKMYRLWAERISKGLDLR
jgi:lysophospholipase L1-like esterase